MKKFLFFAAACVALVSCSNDEFFGVTEATTSTSNEIAFNLSVPNLTRATTGGAAAAQKLNNNFVVYGSKYFGTEPADKKGVSDSKKQQNVFTRYNVNYIGNGGSTKSNTKGWEYVGYSDLQGDLQTMHYWDYKADGYVFSAISGIAVTPEKIQFDKPADPSATPSVYNKGWNVVVPAGGSISSLYASNRVDQKRTEGADHVYTYPETVNLTFYSMATKIRFGIYETVPGYSIHIDKFYCKNKNGNFTKVSNSTTNFGINGKFYAPNVDKSTTFKVTYYDATTPALENRPKVTIDPATVTPVNPNSALFGTNMQATDAIGETSATATYDKAGGEYTFILPVAEADNNLKLYVDFTLTAPNGETIKVSQARATIPAAYTQWKENFAYTYLFKIADNTNGTTGDPKDPNNPEEPWDPSDPRAPEGLYTITFDACVVNAEAGLAGEELEGTQETVTSVATPSITTYAQGAVVTANNEYTADVDSVYYSASDNATNKFIDTDNSAVYQVIYNGKTPLTEALIADYSKNNGVVLVPVVTAEATSAPLSDGSKLTFADKQCKRFKVAAGNNYVVVYTVGTTKTYKLVRVAGGTGTTPKYHVVMNPRQVQKITEPANSVAWILQDDNNDGKNILGAAKSFVVKEVEGIPDVTNRFEIVANGDAGYQLQLKDSAVSVGDVNGNFVVTYGKYATTHPFNVALKYEIVYDPNDASVEKATVVMDGKTDTVALKVASVPYTGAQVTGLDKAELKGITVNDLGNGQYEIVASADATTGDKTFKLAGQDVKVKVVSYSLVNAAGEVNKTIDWPETKVYPTDLGEDGQFEIQLQENGAAIKKASAPIVSSNTQLCAGGETDADGKFTVQIVGKSSQGGKAEFTYENAKFTYTVNKWELKSSVAEITRTQSTKLTFWLNGEQQNAAAATVKVYKKKGDSYPTEHLTSGYTLTSNGRDLTFANVSVAGTYKIEFLDKLPSDPTCKVLGIEEITVKDED